MREVLWDSLVEGLQSGKCVLVLGPDVPALRRSSGPAAPGAADDLAQDSARDAFCHKLTAEMRAEGLTVADKALFGVAQQYEDAPVFQDVKLKNIAAKRSEEHTSELQSPC